MNLEFLLEDLKAVLEKLEVEFELRNLDDEELNIKSGFCEVKKERKLIVDKHAHIKTQLNAILRFLKKQNLEDIYIPPRVREIIESHPQ